jgi:leader peptidase (prepilin peptidase) / N-methyltransferase
MPITPADFSALQSLLAVWLFAVGGAVGSFLNVVVYRLPLGMSLIQPGSHCPRCSHPIRWRDNIPVLGWLLLRGRCRDCGAPISVRYPLVEALTAVLFLTVGMIEGLGGGANLPRRPIAVPDGVFYASMSLEDIAGIVAYHLLLLSTLLAAALIEHDQRRAPWRLAIPALAIGLAAPLAWPQLHPVPALLGQEGWLSGLVDGATGLTLGSLIGLASWRLIGSREQRCLLLGPICAGVFLGWQAVAVLGPLVLLVHLAACGLGARWPLVRRGSPGMVWLAVGLVWLLAWRSLVGQWPVLGIGGF